MALLDEKTRNEYLKELGYGSVKDFQRATMYPQWVDGVYGVQTDNALRTAYNVHKYCKNFDTKEFRCECGGKYCGGYPDYMKPAELKHIQAIRDHYGRPITITSGLRCKEWNRVLNGSVENSGHLHGVALDFYQQGVTDTLANRKSALKYFMSLPNHKFSYGANMNGSDGIYRSASYMGNAMHTETYNNESSQPDGKLNVDGIGGAVTVRALQKRMGTPQDGIISGQNKALGKYYPSLTAVQYGYGGSKCIAAVQRWAGCADDGIWGKDTSLAVQKKLISLGYSVGSWGADGIFGTDSMKALQKWLNNDKPTPVPPTPTDYYKMIDVSEFQSSIDWSKVKADGVKGVIVRCGGRGGESGNFYEDVKFVEYIKGAHAVGLPVGIYFLTQAVNAAEGKAEAEFTIAQWAKVGVPISYPICIDSENVTWTNKDGTKGYGRANDRNLSRAKRTEAIKGFCDECKRQGYESMLYASVTWLENQVDMSKLSCAVWVAQYYSVCQYEGKYIIWQYTSEGRVNGVSGVVDMNRCYVQPKAVNPPKPTPTPDKKPYGGEYPNDAEIRAASNVGIHEGIKAWCKEIADSDKYHYVTFTDDTYTHECPICTKRTYDLGWNCIGFAFASWRHGGNIPCACNCGVLYNGLGDNYYYWSDADVLASMKKRIGVNDIRLIRNSNKAIPESMLEVGDLLMFYVGKTYKHMAVYVGNGKYADSTSGRTPNIKTGVSYAKSGMNCLFAIRYTGTRPYLAKYDEGTAVKKLQNYLIWFGLDLGSWGADGIFGEATEKAVKVMQKTLGVEVDGLVGTDTLKAMKAYKK